MMTSNVYLAVTSTWLGMSLVLSLRIPMIHAGDVVGGESLLCFEKCSFEFTSRRKGDNYAKNTEGCFE